MEAGEIREEGAAFGPFRRISLLGEGSHGTVWLARDRELNITIAAIGYYYLTNRFTGAVVFERDLMAKSALKQRLAFNTDTILRLVLTPKMLAKLERAT